ncbi:MAG: thiamine phosphate synthase [Candidatus Hydrogenedentes bacterium]|nr:thiamine phosphate synthase [Candidatus Hydrogenedentota bacterium]
MTLIERMHRFRETDLYVVITSDFCAGRSPLAVLDACLDAGVRLIQVREKSMDTADLFDLVMAFRVHTEEVGALLLVDDRLDVALAAGADGVHLGQRDLPVEAARYLAPELIIGASTHSLSQALAAEHAGASYVNIGPIFPTSTKTATAPPLGPDAISLIAPELGIPFTCMGGIKLENVREVAGRGARHIAVVTAVTAADDVAGAARALRLAMGS